MIFVDRVSWSSLIQLIPYLMIKRYSRHTPVRLRYFDASPRGGTLLKTLEMIGWVSGEELAFSFVDVLDEGGANILELADAIDTLPICDEIRSRLLDADPLVNLLAKRFDRDRLILYIQRTAEETLTTVLMRISTVSWFLRTEATSSDSPSPFYIDQTPWHHLVKKYALARNVDLRSYRSIHWPTGIPGRRLSFLVLTPIRQLLRGWHSGRRSDSTERPPKPLQNEAPYSVAVGYHGNGVTLDPAKNSDLFWVPFAELEPEQLLVYSLRGGDPLDDTKYGMLRKSRIRATAIRSAVQARAAVPAWPSLQHLKALPKHISGDWKWLALSLIAGTLGIGSSRWVGKTSIKFILAYIFWKWFFASYKVKIHVDYWIWDKARLASDQAISDLGGLSVSYQRSYHPYASFHFNSAVDIHFAFSTAWASLERQSSSSIVHLVANGYVHDHAFAGVRGSASRLRDRLQASGARFIICFLDENSYSDGRLGPDHIHQAENYRYLLERLLADPTLGLIFKPKKPGSYLRRRLDSVSGLLDAALETGRCYLHESGITATEMLPCEASLASDVTIGIVYGATAAFESALAGTPTLLLDRESMTCHPLYVLGNDRVVFGDWDRLWEALSRYRIDPGSEPGFGDWYPSLSTLDEFRDGKAAHRMGQYVSWLIQGITNGLGREEAMELARHRYTAQWGIDKVVDIRAGDVTELR